LGPDRAVHTGFAPDDLRGEHDLPIFARGPERHHLLWITSLSPTTAPRYRADVGEVKAVNR